MIDIHFLNWARVLANEYGGQSTVIGEEVRVEGSSDKWDSVTGSKDPIVLSSNPQHPDAWRTRLQFVEKRTSRAVNSSPVGFSCSMIENGKARDSGGPVEVVRLAFGLSLSLGASLRRRYTAYYLSNTKQALYIQGQDRLFAACTNIGALDLRNKALTLGTEHLLGLLKEVEREYSLSTSVQEQTKSLNETLSSELRELDRLYKAGHGQYAQLLGRAPEPLKGDDAIESEYLHRLEDLLRKYRLSVLFTPLSLGIVRCKVRITTKGKVTGVSLPFVDNSFSTESASR
jgi:hypothetical protein